MPSIDSHGSLSGYDGVRAVVLGAGGFIGRWVAQALAGQGAQVYLVVLRRSGAEEVLAGYCPTGEIIATDLRHAAAVQRLLWDLRPAIVFNLVGYGVDPAERDESLAYAINADLPRRLCAELAAAHDPLWPGQALVHAGSALEYGAAGGDLAEETEPLPGTLYGRSKLAGAVAVRDGARSSGMRAVTARLFMVYGPGERPDRLLPALLAAARSGHPLPLTAGEQKRDFTYVADVAAGLLRLGLVQTDTGGIINLATGKLTAVRTFVESAARILHIPAERLLFGAIPTRLEEMQHSVVNIEKLKRLTGWTPATDIVTGIKQTAALSAIPPRHQS